MPFAVTHVILTIIAVDLYRDYFMKNHKRYLTLHTVFLAGVGGILPDLDYAVDWVARHFFDYVSPLLQHGGALHTPIMALPFLLIGWHFWRKEKHKVATIFFALTFGILFHILLDYAIRGAGSRGLMFFWPFSTATYSLYLLPNPGGNNVSLAMLDGVILLLWLWHEEWKHKISDYI